jgi:hypothetical protein
MLFFTCATVDLIFTKFQILSGTLIGNLYKFTKNLDRHCPKYIYLRLHVKCLLVFPILTKLNWSTNLGKNSLCKISLDAELVLANRPLFLQMDEYNDFHSCFAKWSKI